MEFIAVEVYCSFILNVFCLRGSNVHFEFVYRTDGLVIQPTALCTGISVYIVYRSMETNIKETMSRLRISLT
ncbi:hypothetical protein M758_12G173300 [Ceratodon purpureus]|nr:hypothetical protein M758_12G173300 [Ceratodon purpureus]